jgi:hypothetical protein
MAAVTMTGTRPATCAQSSSAALGVSQQELSE